MKKRIISLLLVAIILVGMIPAQAFAQVTEPKAEVDTNDMTIEGNNGFGNLLSATITEEQASTAEETSEHEAGYNVIDLEFAGNVATVTYNTLEEAILVVAVYSEDGLQMLASGSVQVSPNNETTYVTIEGDMPEYFLASAYLMDTYDMSPLCAAYDTPMYTQEMQELLASTIHDYDADRVLNLDEDETTNFAVYAEDTIVIEASEGVNTVSSADDENHIYVIENADASITSLAEGDVFVYPYGEDQILIVKVASIEVDGTTVTITGREDLEIEDVFSHVKIEGSGNKNNGTIDGSTATKGIEYFDTADGITPYGVDSRESDSGKMSFSIGLSFDAIELGGKYANIKWSGKACLSVAFAVEFYVSASYQRVDISSELSLDGNVSVSGEVNVPISLGSFSFEIIPSILQLGSTIRFVVKTEGKVEASIAFGVKFGVTIEGRGRQGFKCKGYCKPNFEMKTVFEGKLFYGFELEPNAKVLYGALVDLKVTAECGEEYTLARELNPKESEDEHHLCDICYSGEAKRIFTLEGSAKFLQMKRLSIKVKILEVSKKMYDIYYTPGKMPFSQKGHCPNLSYKLTVKVVDTDGEPVKDAAVNVGGNVGTTDKDGIVELFLPVAEYDITVTKGDITRKHTLYMDAAQKINVRLSPDGGAINIFDSIIPEDIIDDTIAYISGKCGNDLFWSLDNHGRLMISGTGPMWNYDYNGAPWYSERSSITSVWLGCGIVDQVTGIGDYAFYDCTNLTRVVNADSVTTIGDYAFFGCTNLTRVVNADSVTTIGDYAFFGCESLTSVEIPDSVTIIGDYAFCDCESLISVKIPNGVITIGEGAFHGCDSLTSISIPDSVTSIGDDVFGWCASLTEIHVNANNPNYSSDDRGVLFNKEKSKLIKAPGAMNGAYEIPDTVTTIGDDAFEDCNSLTNVEIPDGVTTIGDRAFMSCLNLAGVTVPDSVTYIGKWAFLFNLYMTIYFCGNAPAHGDYICTDCTVYYPAGNTTWTTKVMESFGDNNTWVPYNLDENGNMMINEATAVTVFEELAYTNVRDASVEVTGLQSGLGVPAPDFGDQDETVAPYAVYDGEYSTVATDTYTLKTASFSGLVPGQQYVLLAMVSIDVEDPLAADNLLYIDQAAALEDGTLVFQYVQRTPTDTSYVVACGASNKNLNDAEITFPEMVADGEIQIVNPTVIYDGKVLVEGQDYTIQGTVSVTEPGTYTCYIRGVRNYTGLVECAYTVISPYYEVASGTCGDNLTWTFYDNGRLTISGTGPMTEFSSFASVPWDDRRSSIVTVIINHGVTTIGDYAFFDCASLTSVAIGNSVTNIGDYAFASCTSLTSVTLPDSVTTIGSYVFRDCISLTGVTIGDSVTAISNGAFYNCDSLTIVEIPDSVTNISAQAFQSCNSLMNVAIGDGVTDIGYAAFRSCTSLISITIGSNVTVISNGAFQYCDRLTSIEFPNSVTTICDYVFWGCSSLGKVTFMGDAPAIDEGAFLHVTTTAYYPANNPTWNENVLQNYSGTINWVPSCTEHSYEVLLSEPTCTEQGYTTHICSKCGDCYVTDETAALGHSYETVVTKPTCTEQGRTTYICSTCGDSCVADETEALGHTYESVTNEDGELAYICITCGVSYTEATLATLEYVVYEDHVEITNYKGSETGLVIPSKIEGLPVTIIAEEAFYDCTSLISITIPYGITTIGNYAFAYCENLCSVSIGKSVTTIGDNAFRSCTSLTSVTIPNGVTTIGASAFRYCTSLTNVEIPNSVITIGDNAFWYCTNLSQITFMGNAPAIAEEAFYSVTATAYYRVNNHTWTENVRQNYGGIIIWEAYSSECTDHSFEAVVTEPTCTKRGYTTYTCPECGDSYVANELEALGHIYESTATENGELKYTCLICGYSYVEATLATLEYVVYEDHIGITGYTGSAAVLVIPAEIEGLPVTVIESGAFFNCITLASVTIPDGVTAIGFGAFQGCWWMNNITIPESVTAIGRYAFEGCESLYSVTIPDGITSIGEATFKGCTNLRNIDIPDSVTYIGDKAFYWCNDLSSVTIPDSVTEIDFLAFFHCISLSSITIPDSVTEISSSAFGECTGLTSIYFDGHAPAIDSTSFEGVTASAYYFADLTSWTEKEFQNYGGTITWVGLGDPIPVGLEFEVYEDHVKITYFRNLDTTELVVPTWIDRLPVTIIGDGAFSQCDYLTSITIPDSVTSIGSSAFARCTSLTSINIPDSVTYIGEYAFKGCESLTRISIPNRITHIGDFAFYDCSSLTGSVTIPVSLTSMGTGVFSLCDSLTGMTIQDGVTTVVDWTFSGCKSLRDISIPDSVISIGEMAFSDCDSLTSINIPAGVTFIGSEAFFHCSNLITIHFQGDAPMFGEDVFLSVYGTVYYPGDNPTWTSELMENCNSYSINWVAEGEVFGMEIVSAPKYGVVGVAPDLSELFVELIYGNDIHRLVANSKLTISDVDTTTAGKKKVTVCYDDFSAQFTYGVHETTSGIVLDPSLYPESSHSYGYKIETKTLTWPGADCLELVFSKASALDWLDHISVYDGKDNLIAWYRGSEKDDIAGITLVVPGDTVKIRFESSTTSTCYGYSFTCITAKSALHTGSVVIPGEEATCTEPGRTEGFICEICDQEQYTVIPALNHDYESVVTPPTCTEQGYTTHTCHCGDSFIDSYVDALGHSLIHHEAKATSCTEHGWNAYDTCEHCDYTTYVEIAATGHSYDFVVTDPTCTERGYTTHTCHCGDSYIDSYVEATGHNYEVVDSKEPTATEDGYKVWHCNGCGDEYTETLPAMGAAITWGDINGDGNVNYMDAYLVMRYSVGLITGDGLDLTAADVSGDGMVNYMDAYLIMRWSVGLIDKFPVE